MGTTYLFTPNTSETKRRMGLVMLEDGRKNHTHQFVLAWKNSFVWGDIVLRKVNGRFPSRGLLISTINSKWFIPLFPVRERNQTKPSNGRMVRFLLNAACMFSYRASKIRRLAQCYSGSDRTILREIFSKQLCTFPKFRVKIKL